MQRFAGPIDQDRCDFRDDLAGWSEQAGVKPVLVADVPGWSDTSVDQSVGGWFSVSPSVPS